MKILKKIAQEFKGSNKIYWISGLAVWAILLLLGVNTLLITAAAVVAAFWAEGRYKRLHPQK